MTLAARRPDRTCQFRRVSRRTIHRAPLIALAVTLAFAFGYAFTMAPLLRHGLSLRVELGPLSELLPQATTDLGEQTGQELASPFTFLSNGALIWRR